MASGIELNTPDQQSTLTLIPENLFAEYLRLLVVTLEEEDVHGEVSPDTYKEFVRTYSDLSRAIKEEEIKSL